ncbi:MAG: nucleotidyltransferase domain-containing protein [Cyanobacteria bacterium HKST-UBA02]|nr:nucleotidyltransferase domain-containing protein [Cyanobacteria bacterium HKST-UBA02]
MTDRPDPEEAALEIQREHFPDCLVLFLSGSVITGQATATSDLDIVVFFDSLESASRKSFFHRGWPVETFLHDRKSFQFFCAMDGKAGRPFLANMVVTGIALPEENDFSRAVVADARRFLDAGPAPLSRSELDRRRYSITNHLDDIREPRSRSELYASGARLLEELSDFYFRSHGLWSASHKSIIRALDAADAGLCARFESAFDSLFRLGQSDETIAIGEEILTPFGGRLFDGYSDTAPPGPA